MGEGGCGQADPSLSKLVLKIIILGGWGLISRGDLFQEGGCGILRQRHINRYPVTFIKELAATPQRPLGALEEREVEFVCNFSKKKSNKKIKYFGGWDFFLGTISLGRVVVPSHKIVINLPGTYKKLHCKYGLYRFSGQQDLSLQTKKAYYFI